MVLAAALHLSIASPRGGYDGHYTDQLRHMASARALLARGFDVYTVPYGQVARTFFPCPAHAGLFEDRTAPYPPLGLLLHAPLALLEAGGAVAPERAHRLQTLASLLAGLGAVTLAWALSRARADLAGVMLVALPLLLGVGANGFYDTFFLTAGLGALLCLERGRPLAAVLLSALAASLSFRALVFAPLGLAAWCELRRRWPRGAWVVLGGMSFVLAPAVASAVAVAPSLGQIPAHNPLHVDHLLLGKPRPWAFAALAAAAVGLAARRRAWLAAGSALAAWVVTLSDRSYGYWHALPLLVPWLASGVERGTRAPRGRWLALVFLLLAFVLAYRHPLEPAWRWLVRIEGSS